MLLQDLRKSMKPIMWIVAIGFITSLFFMYGRMTSQKGAGTALVKVNGNPIPYSDFARSYQSTLERYRQTSGEELSPQLQTYLQSQVLSQMVIRELIWQESQKAKIKVTPEEIKEQIRGVMKSFGSEEAFMRYLNYQRFPYSEFEENVARQLAIYKFSRTIKDAVTVTDEEIKNYWVKDNERLKAEYIMLDPQGLAGEIKVPNEEVKKYYEKNKEEFKIPDQVKISYIFINPEEYNNQVEITKEIVRNYYDSHPKEFQVEEKRSASHILVRVSSEAEKEEENQAREKIEEIENKLKKGEDFALLAEEYSEDISSAEKEGDLGYFTYEMMTPNFSQAVFSLKKTGDVSEIVRTPYGFHLIKLTGIEPAYTTPFEKARQETEEKLTLEKTNEMAQREIQKIAEDIKKGEVSFESYARENPEKIETTPFFTQYESIKDLGWMPQLNQAAFSLNPGQLSSPIKNSQGYFLLEVLDKKPSYIPSLEETRDKVREKVAEITARKMAQGKIQEVENHIKAGRPLSSFNEEWGIEYQNLDYFTRQDWIEGIERQDREKFIAAAFSLKKGAFTSPLSLNKGFYIIKVQDRQLLLEQFSQEKEEFKEKVLSVKKDTIFSAWLEKVRAQAKIEDFTSSFFRSS